MEEIVKEHHHEHEECGCGHHHEHHHEHEECGCGHHHEHHHEHEECGCGHHHEHHHEHEECGCGHHHEHHHEHEECGCGHHHEHHHEHEECGCGCEHDHHAHIEDNRTLAKANYRFRVRNLDCANCAMKVERKIKELDIVEDAVLSFSTQLLLIKSKEKDLDVLLSILNETASKAEKGVIIVNDGTLVQEEKHTWEIVQLIIGTLGLVLVLSIEKSLSFSPLFLYSLIYLIVGFNVLKTAIKNILKGEVFDENFLMAIASIGALFVGSYEEAVAVMLFYDLGELLQSIAVQRSRRSISDLMNINTESATVLKDGKEIVVTPEEICVGDLLIIKAGERVAVDGVVVEGTSSLDVSALTGESLPKDIKENDDVLAGSMNVNGVFTMKAVKPVHESTVARVMELVETASSKKAKIEKFITKFAKVYTPIVVLAAILVTILPPLLGLGDFNTWLYRGCTFLVISCPCALVISVPLGLFAGIGAASKVGVLVKGGNYLEHLSEMDTLVFDKTGTITKGVFKVGEVFGHKNTLMLAAYGENYSNHPIAKSIVSEYGRELDNYKVSEYEEIAGQGISAMYENKELLVGNAKLLQANNIEFEEAKVIGSIVYVAYDHVYYGYIVINDEIKESSTQAISVLKQQGIKKTIMLTGDKQEIAFEIAKEAGIDKVCAELLPQDKVAIFEKYLGKDHIVGFVGDGINDAPVLMRADIGIAMGGIGSDAAIEASDVVLMNDDLMSIASAMKIARKTKVILWQNIIFSLLIKGIVLVLALFGIANMWLGVFADVGVTLLAVLNSMRALKA